MNERLPCGEWPSPIGTDLLAAGSIRLGEPGFIGGAPAWIEGRPTEGGRAVLVRQSGGGVEDLIPEGFSVRSRVHEYGGGTWTADHDGPVYFVNDSDQQVYRRAGGGNPEAVTRAHGLRFADLSLDPGRGRLLAVCEDCNADEHRPPATVVAIDTASGRIDTIATGRDFFSTPRTSPDGRRVAWLQWDHPDMPWDATALCVAEFDGSGVPGESRVVAGGDGESIFQPEWGPDGMLYFASDRETGWWNLHRWTGEGVERLTDEAAEFAMPHWMFGMRTFAHAGKGGIVCGYTHDGLWYLARLDTRTKRLARIPNRWNTIRSVVSDGERVLILGGGADRPEEIAMLEPAADEWRILRRTTETEIDSACISRAEPVDFPTGNGETAHALFYPPTNPDCRIPEGERPPLLVKAHGGPTGSTDAALDWRIQYWTSRGFAVLDVNYRGSTGYSRPYRRSLYGRWGEADVEDCVNGARHLVAQGRVDGERLAISGSSAGGYTVLCALTFHDAFRAGASYYGIGDLEGVMAGTHKFEARYGDRLVGPLPEARATYRARSPLYHADQLACPVIFLQGTEDRVVPPQQSRAMVDTLQRRGLPVAYIEFEGEGHGFRAAGAIRRAIEAELYFYGRVFGFNPADAPEPVTIENL